MIHLCDYGCEQEAKYQFKNGKWCCSKNIAQCSAIRKKVSKKLSGENHPRGMLGKHHTEEARKKQGESQIGKHPTEETRKKIGLANSNPSEETLKKRRTPFKKIIKFTEDEGCELLSKETDYKNQFSYLWFRCSKGHEFYKRWDSFKSGSRCPECANKKVAEKTSQRMKNGGAAYALSFIKNPSGPQVELFNLVKEDHPESIMNYQVLNYSIDVVIPNLKIAIEYDGSYWHQDQEKDTKRQKEIEDQGWIFLRYRDYVPSKEELKRDIFFKIQNLRSYS